MKNYEKVRKNGEHSQSVEIFMRPNTGDKKQVTRQVIKQIIKPMMIKQMMIKQIMIKQMVKQMIKQIMNNQ